MKGERFRRVGSAVVVVAALSFPRAHAQVGKAANDGEWPMTTATSRPHGTPAEADQQRKCRDAHARLVVSVGTRLDGRLALGRLRIHADRGERLTVCRCVRPRRGARTGNRSRGLAVSRQGRRPVRRGIAYWPGDATNLPRIVFTSERRLIALTARTGEPVGSFGTDGVVDMSRPINPRRRSIRTC